MKLTVIEGPEFAKLVGIEKLGAMFIATLQNHGLKYELITVPSSTIEHRLTNHLNGREDHVVIATPATDDFIVGNSLQSNPTYICCIIYISSLDKLVDLIKRTYDMKAFL